MRACLAEQHALEASILAGKAAGGWQRRLVSKAESANYSSSQEETTSFSADFELAAVVYGPNEAPCLCVYPASGYRQPWQLRLMYARLLQTLCVQSWLQPELSRSAGTAFPVELRQLALRCSLLTAPTLRCPSTTIST